MLLKYKNDLEILTIEDAKDFYSQNETEICDIIRHYSICYPEYDNESLSSLTLVYLLHGSNIDIPDFKFDLTDEEVEDTLELMESDFLLQLYKLVYTTALISDMIIEGTIKFKYDKSKNCNVFTLTNKGKKELSKNE